MREPQSYKQLQRVRTTPGPPPQNSQWNKVPVGWGWEGFKALLQLTNFTLDPHATLNPEIHKISVRL